MYETPYDITDPDFPECTIDRPSGASATGRMGLVNHFLDLDIDLFGDDIYVPDATAASTTNSISSITAQTSLCLSAHGRLPNFVLVSERKALSFHVHPSPLSDQLAADCPAPIGR